MAYLIKATIAWTIFLTLFELLYKSNGRFTTNRIYLLLSIAIGLLFPIITFPSTPLSDISVVRNFSNIPQHIQRVNTITTPPTRHTIAMPITSQQASGWHLLQIVVALYCIGVLILLLKYLSEVFKIAASIRNNQIQIIFGHKVIATGKVHSPYSFMRFTFLTDPASLDPKELEYIIRHEAAHNTRKHWLDLWLLQLVNIIFWFHPLIWRYRYLLRMQHEYEADAIAANDDPYTYGKFILQQAMLLGVPSITHSFHFSPIKNRINMLTKTNSFKTDNRKYLLLIPALLGCTFLMAKSANKKTPIQGNKIVYQGNTLTWVSSDTIFYDKQQGKAETVQANAKVKPQVIVGINDEAVLRNDYLQTQASYGNNTTAFAEYIKEEFHKLRENTADSLTYLVDLNLVVDKNGKVVYYEAHYARDEKTAGQQPIWYTFFNSDAHANELMSKIIDKSPLWTPASQEGKTVNSYVSVRFPGC